MAGLLKTGPFARGELVAPCCGGLVKGHELSETLVPGSPPTPVPGDLTVCERCLCVLEFRADGTLRRLSVEEIFALSDDAHAAIRRTLDVLEERRG